MTEEQQKRAAELAARLKWWHGPSASGDSMSYWQKFNSDLCADAAELLRLLAPETPGQRIVREANECGAPTNGLLAAAIDALLKDELAGQRTRIAQYLRIEYSDAAGRLVEKWEDQP
jgi:hypothetical protein